MSRRWKVPMYGLGALAWLCLAGPALAQTGSSGSDLTAEGAVGRGTVKPTIIDTRKVQPQIQASFPWKGKVTPIKDHLPGHKTPDFSERRDGGDNGLSSGGLLGETRTVPGQMFPGISQTPWTPPDPTLAVGPNHIVETVNMALAFYDKSTGELQFSQNLDSTGNPGFFEEVGAGSFTFDPKCVYDHYTGRFIIVALEVYGSSQSWIDIAVSDDSDPNGVWYKYRTNSVIRVGNATYWVDYPGVGYDQQGYYITGNLFKLSGNGGGFAGALYRSFDKAPLQNGGTASYTDIRDGSAASVQAGQHFGSPETPFFVQDWSTTAIKISAIRDPFGSPSLVGATVSVPAYGYPGRYSVPNRGGSNLDSIDGRIINVTYRDGRLYAGHGVWLSSRNQARWYEFALNNWPNSGSPTLTQSGNIDTGSGVHTWFPALVENACGDVGIVVAKSSRNDYASVEVTGRRSSDPPGTMGALTQLKIGTSGYNGQRWGDYFDIAVDPEDDSTFWVVGEYATGTGTWNTWIGDFTMCDGGGDICDDVKKLVAKCKANGTIKAKLRFRNTNHDGRNITFTIDGDPFDATVNGKKAKLSICCYSGTHSVGVSDPDGCVDPKEITCP